MEQAKGKAPVARRDKSTPEETAMKILLMTQLFLPEMGALPNRIYPFARDLTAMGHSVFVATGMPNYPKGVVFDEYKGKWLCREQVDGFTVLPTSYYTVPRNRSKWSQLLSYLSFMPAALWSGLRAGKLDIVFVTSPPIFPVVPAIALAWFRGAKLVFDVRDLWPDEIVACGGARENSFPVRVVRALERWAYRRADRVCCTTQGFLTTVAERGVSSGKGVYLPNGADLELFRPLPFDDSLVARPDLHGRFVVMYSGVFGIKHGLHTVLEAAKLLEDERDILFVLMGSGAREAELVQQAKAMNLRNAIFAGEHKVREIPHWLARADVCISSLLPEPYLEKILSVKIFEYLACGKPVVGAHSGESARVLMESGGGLVVPPSDAQAMAGAIRALYRDPDLRVRM